MGFLAAAMGNCKIQSQGLQVREISTKKLPKPEHPTQSRLRRPIHVKDDQMHALPAMHCTAHPKTALLISSSCQPVSHTIEGPGPLQVCCCVLVPFFGGDKRVQPPRVGHLPPRLPRSQIPDLAVPSLPWISKMSARSHTTLPLSLPQAQPRVTKGTTGNPKTPLVLVMDPAIAGRTLSPPPPTPGTAPASACLAVAEHMRLTTGHKLARESGARAPV